MVFVCIFHNIKTVRCRCCISPSVLRRQGSNLRLQAYEACQLPAAVLRYEKVRRQARRLSMLYQLSYMDSKSMAGLEPAAFGLSARRSYHYEGFLSYGTHIDYCSKNDKVPARQMHGASGIQSLYRRQEAAPLNPVDSSKKRSLSSLWQPPPCFSSNLKEHFIRVVGCKVSYCLRNFSAYSDFFLQYY